MTTPHDPRGPLDAPGDPLLTEEEEREVAALLAETSERGPVPTPPEVTARLDDVLAGLVAERARPTSAATPTTGSVTALEERRSRRLLPRALLAAAAVVVGGYAVGNLATGGSLGGGSSDSGSDTAGGAGSAADSQAEERASGPDSGLSGASGMSVVPTVRPDHLAEDVRRVVRLFDRRPVSSDPSASTSTPGTPDELRSCPVPRLTDGQRLFQVRYRGAPAGLVVGPEEQGSVDVTVYACGDGGVRVARTVPAP